MFAASNETWKNVVKAICFLISLAAGIEADEVQEIGSTRKVEQRRLIRLRDFVGEWRGVGQVRRGSTKGAWIERSTWIWKITPQHASLNFISKQSHVFQRGELRPERKPEWFLLNATASESGLTTQYMGKFDKHSRLVLTAEKPARNMPARVTLRLVAKGNRLITLYERQTASGRFLRLSEVGYTRRGSDFGKQAGFIECVVSGGKGTIPVTSGGKTYYVCCGGCRDYFQSNAREVLQEYRERKAQKK